MIYLAIMGSRKYREVQHNKNTRIIGCHVKNAKFWLNEKADELASVGSVAVTENAKQLQQPMERDSPASQCGLTYTICRGTTLGAFSLTCPAGVVLQREQGRKACRRPKADRKHGREGGDRKRGKWGGE